MITENEARAVLAQLEEPVTKTDYVTGKMLEKSRSTKKAT